MSEKEKLVEVLENHYIQSNGLKISMKHKTAVVLAEYLMENGVASVIRCGQCRNHIARSGRCTRNEGIFSTSDFCSKGESK